VPFRADAADTGYMKKNELGPQPFWAVGKKMLSFSCFPATQKRSH